MRANGGRLLAGEDIATVCEVGVSAAMGEMNDRVCDSSHKNSIKQHRKNKKNGTPLISVDTSAYHASAPKGSRYMHRGRGVHIVSNTSVSRKYAVQLLSKR